MFPFGARAAAVAIAALAGACAAEVGDLGRKRPSIWNDAVYPAVGEVAARGRGEAVSGFPLTDDEIILRDRAYRFIVPAHEATTLRLAFDAQVQELARTRILPVAAQSTAPGAYVRGLLARPFNSETSRYRRLAEDAAADRALVAPFRHTARIVAEADRVRLLTAALSDAVEPDDRAGAHARVEENEGLVAWVMERLRFRVAEYRHALVTLAVTLPSREAILAERAILGLEAELGLLEKIVPLTPELRGKGLIVKG